MRLGHVALEGTKIRVHASKHKAMSDSRMQTTEPALAAEVAQWLAQAAASDAREDAAYGGAQRGDERPEWVRHKPHRVEKIRAAQAALEAAAAALARKEEAPLDRPRRGRPAKNPPGMPRNRVPRNFTDPDSRIMKAQDGCIQGYTAQAAVDADHPVIVAQGLTNQARDAHPLEPRLAHIKTNTGRQARELSAEAGYCSEHNLTTLTRHHVRGYGATGRQKHGTASATGARTTVPRTRVHAMTIRLTRAGYRRRYRLRKQVVEPVLGRYQTGAGLQTVLAAGPVAGEWSVLCRVHHMLKLAGARGMTRATPDDSYPSALSLATDHGGGWPSWRVAAVPRRENTSRRYSPAVTRTGS